MSPRPPSTPKYNEGEFYPGRDFQGTEELVAYLAENLERIAPTLTKSDDILLTLSELRELREENDKATRILTEFITNNSLATQTEVARLLGTRSFSTVSRWRFNPIAMPRPKVD